MDDPHIVVALPTYNNEDTVERTLRMVTEDQTRPPDRVVVCDKSSDDTRAVVRRVAADVDADTDVEIIDQPGDGVSDAYNAILNHVEGEYDLFVTIQTELIVDEGWLEGHAAVHREHPEVDLVNGDGKHNDYTDREVDPDERPYYVGRNFSATAGALERIDGWDRNFLRGEDWDMRIRLAGAGVRSYARTELGYEWEGEPERYVTLGKAKRKPTSLTFLSKFGRWYLRFHPAHVVADALSAGAVVVGVLGLVTLPFVPYFAFLWMLTFVGFVVTYWVAHVLTKGHVQKDWTWGIVRKQLLNGVAVFYAARRIATQNPDWNMTGFDPDELGSYKF